MLYGFRIEIVRFGLGWYRVTIGELHLKLILKGVLSCCKKGFCHESC